MKNTLFILCFLFSQILVGQENGNLGIFEKVILDDSDESHGYYLLAQAKESKAKGVLVLLPGLGQKAENLIVDTKLPQFAESEGFVVVGFAGHFSLAADDVLIQKLDKVMIDVLRKTKISKDKFIFGGFSAGGKIALSYSQYCKEFPLKSPIQPAGLFMVDAPIDMHYAWSRLEALRERKQSEVSVRETNWVEQLYRDQFGATPSENPALFENVNPFSMDNNYAKDLNLLKNLPIRAYHDVDIAWRLKERKQSVIESNYLVTSAFINRLNILGNDQAEFMQTYQTGFRANGTRHPHSWSIVDEQECISWMSNLLMDSDNHATAKDDAVKPIQIKPEYFAGLNLSRGKNPSQPERILYFKNIFSGDDLNVQIVSSENAFAMVEDLAYDEFLYTINGGAQLEDKSGKSYSFESNDYSIVPKGFSGRWETLGAPDFHLEVTITTANRIEDKNLDATINPIVLANDKISGFDLNDEEILFEGKELKATLKAQKLSLIAREPLPQDEVIFVLAGQLKLWDAAKEEYTYSKGDVFILPKGFTGKVMSEGVQASRILVIQANR